MLILASKYGRLGNCLFLYAKFVTLAIEYHLDIANIAFDEYAEYFQISSQDILFRYPPQKSPFLSSQIVTKLYYRIKSRAMKVVLGIDKYCRANSIWERFISILKTDFQKRYNLDNQELRDISRKGLVFFYGWPDLDKSLYIKHHDRLRYFFRPLDKYIQQANGAIAQARNGADILIGVHIRRGDYREWRGGEYFFEIDVYKKCMRKAEELFPGMKVSFLVCSDEELEWSQFSNFQAYMGSGHFVEELYALAECDYLLGPLSTYSSWASFYGNVPLYVIKNGTCPAQVSDFLHWIDS